MFDKVGSICIEMLACIAKPFKDKFCSRSFFKFQSIFAKIGTEGSRSNLMPKQWFSDFPFAIIYHNNTKIAQHILLIYIH